MQHRSLLDDRLADIYDKIMRSFEEACKDADRCLDQGGNVFIVASRNTGFYAATNLNDIGDDKILIYMSRWAGPYRSFDIYGSAVCGNA